jgi:hypothetical protein
MSSRDRARPLAARLLVNARSGLVMFLIEVGIVAILVMLGAVVAWLLLLAF